MGRRLRGRLGAAVVITAGQLTMPAPFVPAAANECGTGATVTCAAGSYGSGITYGNAGQTVTLQPGVVVSGTNGVSLNGGGLQTLNVSTGAPAVSITSAGTGINVGNATTGVTISAANSTINVSGVGNNGVTAFSSTGTVNVTTGAITVASTATDGFGLFAGSNNGSVTVDTTAGDLITHSGGGVGIYGRALFGSLQITTGNITITGNSIPADAVYGIYTLAGGSGGTTTVTIDTTAGAVNLSGTSTSHAIFAQASNATGNASLTVRTANVSTVAAGAYGILAQTSGVGANGTILIDTHLGTVSTQGAAAIGINAYQVPTALSGPITVNAGTVTTTGTGAAHGIRIGGTGALSANAASVSTLGDGAVGILMVGQNASAATVGSTFGTITTAGVGAHGLQVTDGGTLQVTSTGGSVTTSGNGAGGIYVRKSNATGSTINVGSVTTHGANAPGIQVFSGAFQQTGGAISITANSVVTTGNTAVSGGHYAIGVDSYGIEARTEGAGANGAITIDTSVGVLPGTLGTVSVDGYKATAIDARSGTQAIGVNGAPINGGPIDIRVGNVTANGDFGAGIEARTYGIGASVTVTALGSVTANGLNLFNLTPPENEGNSRPVGISAWALGGGDVTITTHDVTSTGEAAPAVNGQSDGGNVTIDTSAGSVLAKGAGANGVVATFGNSFGATAVSKAVKVTTANVTTLGNFASAGIVAFASGPQASLTIDSTAGTISTVGQSSHAINAIVGGSIINPAPDPVPLTIRTGAIHTTGNSSAGIAAGGNGGPVDVIAFGDITTTGAGAFGLQVGAGPQVASQITVDLRGNVTTTGFQAHALQLDNTGGADGGTNTVTVRGEVSASGGEARGLFIVAGNIMVTIDPTGSVSGTDRAIDITQVNNATVVNYGVVSRSGGTAIQFTGGQTSSFTNGGTVNGDVKLGSGDDLAILLAGSTINGTLDGQGGSDALRLDGAGSGSFDLSRLANFESASKTGAGTWTLTGTGAPLNGFDVQQGRLAVNGSFPGMAVTVQPGGTLAGTGTVGATTVAAGGVHAMGNSIGTQTVTGNYVNAGTLQVEVDPAGSDKLVVTGDVTLTGSTLEVQELTVLGWQPSQSYTIIDNQGPNAVVGTFATVRNVYAFLTPDVLYTADDGNNVALTLTRNSLNFGGMGLTRNEVAGGTGAESLGFAAPLYGALVPLTIAQVPGAFDQISGETHASAQLGLMADSRFIREAIIARTFALLEGRERGGAWMHAYGAYGGIGGDGNAAGLAVGAGGLIFGGDAVSDSGWYVGLAGGIGASRYDSGARNSSADADSFHLAAYGGGRLGGVSVRLGAALSHHALTTTRAPAFAGFAETLSARYDADTAQVFAVLGYPIELGAVTVEPFAGLAGVLHATGGYAETGGVSAVAGGGDVASAVIATLGISASTRFALSEEMTVVAHGSIAWQQTIGGNPTATHAFAGGAPFTVAAANPSGGALALELGAGIEMGENARLDLSYAGLVSGSGVSHGLKATLHVSF